MKFGIFNIFNILNIMLRLLCCVVVLFPNYAFAGQPNIPGFHASTIKPPSPNVLPVLKNPTVTIPGVSVENKAAQNQLIIRQDRQNVIIDWASFNIGADASVQFYQGQGTPGTNTWKPDGSYAALNRIWDLNPSQIFGKLTADGKIYLINQNGILFGRGSQVNVNSLVASALNIANADFINNTLSFKLDNYRVTDDPGAMLDPLAIVANEGVIRAADGGSVFLMAPRVENSGLIDAAAGQIVLAAGTSMLLVPPGIDDTSRSGYYVIVKDDFTTNPDPATGYAVNFEGGELSADGGMVGMYGSNVDQLGIIRSVTAFQNKKGQVELRAANKVTTGANSSISLPVNPSKTDTVNDTFDIQSGVTIGGLQGLNTEGTILDITPVKQIELGGRIEAPAGSVTLSAAERVYLETGSSIDVSGVVADLPAQVMADFKLTSVELRDAYGQKQGVIPGLKITTPLVAGSAIGDLSQAILTQDKTALERSIGGARRTIINQQTGEVTYDNPQSGAIVMTAANGDIIVKEGALLDFSGGAIHYEGGLVNSTKLLSGTKIYDISNAPVSVHYDKVLGDYTKIYERFGVAKTYSGLYYGGGSPLKTYVSSHTKGGDAGTLTLQAATVELDGTLNGSVIRGEYQNTWTMKGSADYDFAMPLSVTSGREIPRAGTVSIHAASISVLSETPPPELYPASPTQAGQPTLISAKTLNNASLGTVNLIADLDISTAAEAGIHLQPGGSFSAEARRIVHEGEIKAPGGSISLNIVQNDTSRTNSSGPQSTWVPLDERIVLGSASRLDVSGERTDYTPGGQTKSAPPGYPMTYGGSIMIRDETDEGAGVFIKTGAVVDVSGGYSIDPKGKVTGGNAGTLAIQGSNIMLDGDLRGYALADANGKVLGGSITLSSKEIHVAQQGSDWSGFNAESGNVSDFAGLTAGRLVLAGDRFDDTGFTQITLNSINDIVIEPDTTIESSLVRLKNPLSAGPLEGQAIAGRPGIIHLDSSLAHMAGPNSFIANAGQSFEGSVDGYAGNLIRVSADSNAKIVISPGAAVRTNHTASSVERTGTTAAVKTNISLQAPVIEVAGTLESQGGNINLTATLGDLWVKDNAKILANGFNRPDPASTPKGLAMNYQPVSGGSVVLSAGAKLILDTGSLVDISGSDAVENRIQSAHGDFYTFREAGNPGSLALTYLTGLDWHGTVLAAKAANVDGLRGATLIVNSTDLDNGMAVKVDDITRYISTGFDDLTLRSRKSLIFSDGMDIAIGRKLTLNAPVIQGPGQSGQDVILSAPWIVLTNSNPASPAPQPSMTSINGDITLSSKGWIDVVGSVQFDGFQNVALEAVRDIRLSEALYNNDVLSGKLASTGDLVLDADRVYPGNFYSFRDGSNVVYPDIYSDYTIHADGKVTIQNSHTPVGGPIYSAGGNLTVEGLGGIEVAQGGTLAAPLGTIALSAPGQRIYLDDGSVLTTAGNAAVNYGSIDPSNIWVTESKTAPSDVIYNSTYFTADSLPGKSITLDADTTITMKGSLIDVSGGGSVFAYKFQPGVEGSIDPLTKANRYIVFKDDSFQMPGTTVYLKAGGGLSEGSYTLLPLDANNPQNARYAFMPGAYIIETQTGGVLPGPGSLTKDGHPLTIGFTGVADTSVLATRPQVYSVRNAAEVLKLEGNYLNQSLVSGNAGDIGLKGNTTIVNGTFKASARQGYLGGKISLSGTNIFVQSGATSQLPPDFGFGTDLDSSPELQNLRNKLTVSTDGLSGQGFREVSLGDGNTQSITINDGTLEAPVISLTAQTQITMEKGTELRAVTQQSKDSGEGVINLATPGNLLLKDGSTVHASHSISLDVNNVQGLQGNLLVDSSALTLKSASIFFGADSGTANGLYLTQAKWDTFTSFEDITLISSSDIQFNDPTISLSAAGSLTLDAAHILGMNGGGTSVSLAAPTVNLRNSGAASTTAALSQAGTFAVSAADQINLGGGDLLLGGFSAVNLNSTNDVTLKGKGSLTTNNADLIITAARVISGSDQNSTKKYIAPNFTVDAGTGAIKIAGSGAVPATSAVPGGLLEMKGRSIELATVLQSDGGTIRLTSAGASANGNDGIFLHAGGRILAKGIDEAPGGNVTLSTDNGSIALETGSTIDVSAGNQGDAGLISLKALSGGVAINGTLLGTAQGGKGGSVMLHTDQINDFAGLNDKLKAGGFTEGIDLISRLGNIDIANDQVLTARHIKLTADDQSAGQINVAGTIEGSDGGSIELYAMNDVNIQSGGRLSVASTDGPAGGNVLLNSAQGWINVNGTVDVSGGTGGTIYMRALRNGTDVKINLDGTLSGARAVYAEAFKSYTGPSFSSSWLTEATDYYNKNTAVSRLEGSAPAGAASFHLLPGIEWTNAGDITVGAAIDLTNNRYQTQHDLDAGKTNMEPGVLTIRAAGNLTFSQNLVDHPTAWTSLSQSPARDSWGFNVVAGADLSSSDYMSVVRNSAADTGNLIVSDQKIVYTESAPLRFASGNDAVIGRLPVAPGYMINSTMSYNLASYDGFVQGSVGRDLKVAGGAVQTATGDIDVNIGRDLNITSAPGSSVLGAIRTTGQLSSRLAFGQDPLDPPLPINPQTGLPYAKHAPPGNLNDPNITSTFYWRYVQGGDITLDVGRHVGNWDQGSGKWLTVQNAGAWENFSQIKVTPDLARPGVTVSYGVFSANYGTSTTSPIVGLATMGGGDFLVHAGGDFLAQAGTFGAGDLAVYSGGDIKGRFLNHGSLDKPGRAEIHAMGNFGAFDPAGPDERVQIELFNSRTAVTAQGDIQVGAVVNPDLASDKISAYRKASFVKSTYTQDTSISLQAGGDVTVAGKSPFYATNSGDATVYETVLPATVNVDAGGSIFLLNNFTLASSATGNLRLVAENGDISGSYNGTHPASILMSDIAPDYWYGLFTIQGTSEINNNWIVMRAASSTGVNNFHGFYKPEDAARQASSSPLHLNDTQAIEIRALNRDIRDLNLSLPKKAEVTAGRDILDITYEGQNIDPGDVSTLRAGRDISMKYVKASSTTATVEQPHEGLIQGGPGVFLVQAGGSIDLGSLKDGIQAIGNGNNPALGTGKSSLVVLSGYTFDKSAADISEFFDTIRKAGDEYSTLMADGKLDEGADLLQQTRDETIAPLLGTTLETTSGAGDINMTSSQIGTSIGQSDIFIIANGSLNLGKTAMPTLGSANKKTGITTGGGGAINIFTRLDTNVNESRVMTFYGGDITVWSDQGSINAGRGSRTAVSASPPKRVPTNIPGVYATVFTPPAIGSGIRAVTYGDNAPEPGNIHLFAPSGIIDAGEAGISGGKIFLWGETVLNGINISFSSGAVGLPQASSGTAALGSLTGSGTMTTGSSQIMSDASVIASASMEQASKMVEDIMIKWLDVQIIDFFETD